MDNTLTSGYFNIKDDSLNLSAKITVEKLLKVKKGETALIVTNPLYDVLTISYALYDALLNVNASPTLIIQPNKIELDYAEPPVIGALKSKPDVVMLISAESLGKDKEGIEKPYKDGEITYDHIFNYLLRTKQIRGFWSGKLNIDIFSRTIPVDYSEIVSESIRLKNLLDKGIKLHITSPQGSNFSVGINGRLGRLDTGIYDEPGEGGNLPGGEIFISPTLNTAEGIAVIDGSITLLDGGFIVKEPIILKIENGYVTNISGGEDAQILKDTLIQAENKTLELVEKGDIPKEMLETYIKNIYNIGEVGLGLNKSAKITGNIIEDEKAYETCHIALGWNYDQDAKALTHLDLLIRNPKVTITFEDGREEILYP